MAENISAKIIDIEIIRGNDISFETSALSRLCYHIQS